MRHLPSTRTNTTMRLGGRGPVRTHPASAVGMDRAAANPFDEVTNPNGIINLGTAENKAWRSGR